uniref:Uncharacterized protein n=1 Tax=Glossina austeni TaxID=7395 RepID=A0A1A9UYL2_GLOAU
MDWIINDEMGLTVGHVVGWAAASAMVIGGVIPYVPQYLEIKKTQDAEGFSLHVNGGCHKLNKLINNICIYLRISTLLVRVYFSAQSLKEDVQHLSKMKIFTTWIRTLSN